MLTKREIQAVIDEPHLLCSRSERYEWRGRDSLTLFR